MVKAIWLLKRRSGMDKTDFHDYWRDKHGPLFCNSPAAQRYVVRYEQNHATPENAEIDDDFDGASVMWFRSIEDFQALQSDLEYQNVVMADGDNFLDLVATKQLLSFAEEPFEIPRS
jgi:uncharacterized protein (TIGR02118 family)